jgi:hypothetical protein
LIPVYAICVVVGFLAALAWIYAGLTASSVEGKATLDPETRFGATGHGVVAGVLGFGLGGMSTSFAGWGTGLAILGAFGGAALAIVAARYLGFEEDDTDGDTD